MNHEALRYSMNWENVSASKAKLVGDWNYHKLIPFVTLDNKEGQNATKRCVDEYKGGWWYDYCKAIFLNGEYKKQAVQSVSSIAVYSFKNNVALE